MLQCVLIRKLTLHPMFEHTAIFNPFSPVFQFIQKPVISFAQQKHFLVSIWNETPRNATLDWNGLKELMPRQMNYLATFKHYFIAILRCKHRALLNVEFGMISLKQKLIVLVKTRQQFPLVYDWRFSTFLSSLDLLRLAWNINIITTMTGGSDREKLINDCA